jgi:glycosyltransferase involved in cell wall biosynthesis
MKALKILLVLQTPWGTGLGMSKVHYDLKLEYEKLGHKVEYLDWNKLYPKGQSFYGKVLGSLFTERILSYLKKFAQNFDVIDANFNCIPYPKSAYNFKGLVVYRSHGLQPLYRQIEQSAVYKKMESYSNRPSFKTRVGNLYRFLQRKDGDYELFSSLKHADIVHALNQAEFDYFVSYGIRREQVFLVPNGVPDEQINSFHAVTMFPKRNELSFIGSWTIRKGIKDLNDILKEIVKHGKIERLMLLGGGESLETHSFFDNAFHPMLHSKPYFLQEQLPKLLQQTKVGIFPSYAEGFGLAILEQLALGIPVVAYDTPGPTDILKTFDEGLLIQPGDKIEFGRKVAELLNLPEHKYKELSERCRIRAGEFKMSTISSRFIKIYEQGLEKLKKQ